MKTKAILLLLATLLIGFLLGILTSAQIRHNRLKEMRSFVSGKDFTGMMMEVINPDKSQVEALDSLMSSFEKNTHNMQVGFRHDFDSLSASFKRSIDTLLTPEQLERVRAQEKRNREMLEKMNRSRRSPWYFYHRHHKDQDSTRMTHRER